MQTQKNEVEHSGVRNGKKPGLTAGHRAFDLAGSCHTSSACEMTRLRARAARALQAPARVGERNVR